MAPTESKTGNDDDSQQSSAPNMYTINGIQVPASFFVQSNDATYIRFGGLLYLANEMGTFRCKTRCIASSETGVIFECEGYLIPNDSYLAKHGFTQTNNFLSLLNEPVIAHGEASSANVSSSRTSKFKYVMAETRSIVRTLRVLTGCSYTALDELDQSSSAQGEPARAQKGNAEFPAPNGQSAFEMLGSEADSSSFDRSAALSVLQSFKISNKGAKEIIVSYLNKKSALVLNNLTDADVKELYGICKKYVAEVKPNESA